jgi:hypothetical protein
METFINTHLWGCSVAWSITNGLGVFHKKAIEPRFENKGNLSLSTPDLSGTKVRAAPLKIARNEKCQLKDSEPDTVVELKLSLV